MVTMVFVRQKLAIRTKNLKEKKRKFREESVREAVAAGICDIVHCDTGFNLADMGTKALPPHVHQKLLLNPVFPPASSAGECQRDLSDDVITVTVNHASHSTGGRGTTNRGNVFRARGDATLTIKNVDESVLDMIRSVEDPYFLHHLLESYTYHGG